MVVVAVTHASMCGVQFIRMHYISWCLIWRDSHALYNDLLNAVMPAVMWLSRAALKLFTDLASTTVVGSKFQLVAVLLVKNLYLPMFSLQISLTIWCVCVIFVWNYFFYPFLSLFQPPLTHLPVYYSKKLCLSNK